MPTPNWAMRSLASPPRGAIRSPAIEPGGRRRGSVLVRTGRQGLTPAAPASRSAGHRLVFLPFNPWGIGR